MIVWGDYSGGNAHPGGRYDPVADSWTPVSAAGAPSRRVFHTAIWTGTRMIVWGGYVGSGIDLNTGGQYDPVTDSWTPTSTAGAPSVRHYHSAIWIGNRMIVWGGAQGSTLVLLNTGGQYDPSTDSWVATSTVGAPSARAQHSVVWTGTQMVVWSGSQHTSVVPNTGGDNEQDTRYVVVRQRILHDKTHPSFVRLPIIPR